MFKTIIAYRLDPSSGSAFASVQQLEEALELSQFVPCTPTQGESFGWIEPRGEANGPLVERVGGQIVLRMKAEHRVVPGAAVTQELNLHLDKIEKETGRRLKGKAKKDLKDEVQHSLLVRAFSKFSVTTVWIDPATNLLVAGVGSIRKGDAVINALAVALERVGQPVFKARPVSTRESPASVMAHWLREQEAPSGFTIDRECELKDNEGNAAVRYSAHSLDIMEIGEHIKDGKAPTKLAMSWGDKVSFMLTDDLVIKKIKMLDVALENKGSATEPANAGADGFEADIAIVTGVLATMLPELFEALGGESDADSSEGSDAGTADGEPEVAAVANREAATA